MQIGYLQYILSLSNHFNYKLFDSYNKIHVVSQIQTFKTVTKKLERSRQKSCIESQYKFNNSSYFK